MDLNTTMKKMIEKQKEVVKANFAFEKERNKVEQEAKDTVKHLLNQKFPNQRFEILTIFSGSMSENWNPRISIYTVNRANYNDNKMWEKDGQYFEFNNGLTGIEIQDFLSTLEQEIGIKVELNVKHVKTASDVKMIRNVEDLKLKYEGIEILKEGKVWHKGWDIADIFFIAKHNDSYILFLSENGHGFGIDLIYKKEDGEGLLEGALESNVERFFKFIENDTDNLGLRKQYEKDILNNWKS